MRTWAMMRGIERIRTALQQSLHGWYVRDFEVCGVTLLAVYFVVPGREFPGPPAAADLHRPDRLAGTVQGSRGI